MDVGDRVNMEAKDELWLVLNASYLAAFAALMALQTFQKLATRVVAGIVSVIIVALVGSYSIRLLRSLAYIVPPRAFPPGTFTELHGKTFSSLPRPGVRKSYCCELIIRASTLRRHSSWTRSETSHL